MVQLDALLCSGCAHVNFSKVPDRIWVHLSIRLIITTKSHSSM
jgi:hypothetical protein